MAICNSTPQDKQRTDTRPEEVHHMYMILKSQNDHQRQELNSSTQSLHVRSLTSQRSVQALARAEARTSQLGVAVPFMSRPASIKRCS